MLNVTMVASLAVAEISVQFWTFLVAMVTRKFCQVIIAWILKVREEKDGGTKNDSGEDCGSFVTTLQQQH